jgi:acetyltransferase-like isoleucine patch superfamily enzyme
VSSAGLGLRVNGPSSVTGRTSFGDNVHLNGLKVWGKGTVTVGSNVHIGRECIIFCEIHEYEGAALPYDDQVRLQSVVIGDNVWLGTRVMVLGDVTIGEGAIIQAGSVVVDDVPPLALAGGHPARVFSQRDRAHYDELKAARRFH